MASNPPPAISLLHLLRERPALRGFTVLRAADELGAQMLNLAIGWYVYAATHDPMSLAYVGLAQFAPNIGLALFAGQAADRFDRRSLIGLSLLVQMICVTAFAVWAAVEPPTATPVYALLLVIGAARSFAAPAAAAILPRVVEESIFPRAVAVTSAVFQICMIVGPALGGILYAVNGPAMIAVAAALYLLALTQIGRLPRGHAEHDPAETADKSILAGVRGIRANRLLLGLISLDLFAVLLGGVTALLPIYARDILFVGPIGLGALRCAPGIGAALVGVFLAHRSIERGAGKLMLLCVAGFGFAVVLFSVSTSIALSLAALAAAGGFDMVSMVIRQTLVQIATPDALRGRVSAVYFMFISASNELGEFESGVAAALFGTVPAALLGGLGTLIVVALWTKLFPELRRADRLVAHAE